MLNDFGNYKLEAKLSCYHTEFNAFKISWVLAIFGCGSHLASGWLPVLISYRCRPIDHFLNSTFLLNKFRIFNFYLIPNWQYYRWFWWGINFILFFSLSFEDPKLPSNQLSFVNASQKSTNMFTVSINYQLLDDSHGPITHVGILVTSNTSGKFHLGFLLLHHLSSAHFTISEWF